MGQPQNDSGFALKAYQEIRSQCPTYHCRTNQLRQDRTFQINVEGTRIAGCHICYARCQEVRAALRADSEAGATFTQVASARSQVA